MVKVDDGDERQNYKIYISGEWTLEDLYVLKPMATAG